MRPIHNARLDLYGLPNGDRSDADDPHGAGVSGECAQSVRVARQYRPTRFGSGDHQGIDGGALLRRGPQQRRAAGQRLRWRRSYPAAFE